MIYLCSHAIILLFSLYTYVVTRSEPHSIAAILIISVLVLYELASDLWKFSTRACYTVITLAAGLIIAALCAVPWYFAGSAFRAIDLFTAAMPLLAQLILIATETISVIRNSKKISTIG